MKGPIRLDEALAGYLRRSGLGERLDEVSVVDEWADKVGDRIAAVATPLDVANGVLRVGVRSSAWLMELRMMEAEIRRRLNEDRSKGRVSRIRFVMEGGDEPAGPRPRGGQTR